MRKVVYLEFNISSYSWNNGLFVLISESGSMYELCKLDKFGEAQRNDDGSAMITVVGKANKLIETKLTYDG